jgi:hypothetical protein
LLFQPVSALDRFFFSLSASSISVLLAFRRPGGAPFRDGLQAEPVLEQVALIVLLVPFERVYVQEIAGLVGITRSLNQESGTRRAVRDFDTDRLVPTSK